MDTSQVAPDMTAAKEEEVTVAAPNITEDDRLSVENTMAVEDVYNTVDTLRDNKAQGVIIPKVKTESVEDPLRNQSEEQQETCFKLEHEPVKNDSLEEPRRKQPEELGQTAHKLKHDSVDRSSIEGRQINQSSIREQFYCGPFINNQGHIVIKSEEDVLNMDSSSSLRSLGGRPYLAVPLNQPVYEHTSFQKQPFGKTSEQLSLVESTNNSPVIMDFKPGSNSLGEGPASYADLHNHVMHSNILDNFKCETLGDNHNSISTKLKNGTKEGVRITNNTDPHIKPERDFSSMDFCMELDSYNKHNSSQIQPIVIKPEGPLSLETENTLSTLEADLHQPVSTVKVCDVSPGYDNPESDGTTEENPDSDGTTKTNLESESTTEENPDSDGTTKRNPESDSTTEENPGSDGTTEENPESDGTTEENPESDGTTEQLNHDAEGNYLTCILKICDFCSCNQVALHLW
jgi:hypothetical protein